MKQDILSFNPFNQVFCSNVRWLLSHCSARRLGFNPFNQVFCSNKKCKELKDLLTECFNPFNQVFCSNLWSRRREADKRAQGVLIPLIRSFVQI